MGVRKLLRRVRRSFRRDQRGGIVVTAALTMLPITLLSFAAVEFSNIQRQKRALQDALDSAALAVARAPTGRTQAQLESLYVSVLQGHLNLRDGVLALSGTPTVVVQNGRVTAGATLAISPIIASMFMNGPVRVSGSSVVLREVKGVEIALVMDNTGSMNENNRIGIARAAAKEFVLLMQQAAQASSNPQSVKISLVPFAGTVNVGSANQAATWLDTGGVSPIHNEIFSTSRGAAASANRLGLLTTMGISWAGCVESRPMPFDIQETAPTSANPSTLFVPYFAPDELDWVPYMNTPGSPQPSYRNRFTTALNNRFSGMYNPHFTYLGGDATKMIQPLITGNDYLPDMETAFQGYNNASKVLGGHWSSFVVPNKDNDGARDYNNVVAGFMEHLGVTSFDNMSAVISNNAGVKFVGKYTNAGVTAEVNASRFDRASLTKGPNRDCTIQPITPLTSNLGAVDTALNGMPLGRNTNVPMGLMWGWHTISPNAPFGQGLAYGTPGNTKIIIVMTDGENTSGDGYSGVGYPWQNRLGNTPDNAAVNAAMNMRLTALCNNIKAQNIVLYTIRVEVAGANTLLGPCASDSSKAFDVTQAAQLTETFREIARSIQNLRIES